jgi:hypothetical protein
MRAQVMFDLLPSCSHLYSRAAVPETMSVALFRLIYVSRVARPTRLADVETIVGTAVPRNAADSVTGMLVYTPSHFLQYLEGDERNVRSTFERIRKDVRHTDVRVLGEAAITARRFEKWAMVARQLPSATTQELTHLDAEHALALLDRVSA